ncbi:MAG: hypothetical protein M3544_12420 [Pseudomonadota bacterium]|nr:hypothetical protein [Pseudomonadota bacterium]
MSEVRTPHAVAEAIRTRKSKRVGIDGTHDSGKSTVARAVAGILGVKLFSLDDYLVKEQGGFLEFIEYDRLRGDVGAVDAYVIEGVCLLHALKRATVAIDSLVYVKRLQLGLWADETELEIDEPLEAFLEKERELTAIVAGDGEPVSDLGLDGEIIRYHYVARPQDVADIVFLRDDDR